MATLWKHFILLHQPACWPVRRNGVRSTQKAPSEGTKCEVWREGLRSDELSASLSFPKRLKLSNKTLIWILCFNIPAWNLSTSFYRSASRHVQYETCFYKYIPEPWVFGFHTLRVRAGWVLLPFTTAEPLNPLAALHAQRSDCGCTGQLPGDEVWLLTGRSWNRERCWVNTG